MVIPVVRVTAARSGYGVNVAGRLARIRSAIAAAAGHCGADHHSDHIVSIVSDEEVPILVDGQACGTIQQGTRRRPAIARIAPLLWSSRDRRDDSGGDVHFADDVIACVRDEYVPQIIDRDAVRVEELGAGSGPAVTGITVVVGPRDDRQDAR